MASPNIVTMKSFKRDPLNPITTFWGFYTAFFPDGDEHIFNCKHEEDDTAMVLHASVEDIPIDITRRLLEMEPETLVERQSWTVM